MSDDSLQLSPTLVQKLQTVLVENDARAQNPAISVQYLAAVIGYVVGQMREPAGERKEYLAQLAQFSQAVFEDVAAQQSQSSPAANQPASGVWRPGDA